MKKIIFTLIVLMLVGGLIACATFVGGKDGEYVEIPNSALKPVSSYKVGSKIKTTTQFSVGYETRALNLNCDGRLTTAGYSGWLNFSTEEYPQISERLERNKEYTVYLTVRSIGRNNNYYYLDLIEGLRSVEELQAARRAEIEARDAPLRAVRNPDSLNLTQYRQISASDFSFEMVAGRLPVGSKVRFQARLLGRPTGTSYKFREIDTGITLTSRHNFVRHLERIHFESYTERHPFQAGFLNIEQQTVLVYVTVQRQGQRGECSIDALNWAEFDSRNTRWYYP